MEAMLSTNKRVTMTINIQVLFLYIPKKLTKRNTVQLNV